MYNCILEVTTLVTNEYPSSVKYFIYRDRNILECVAWRGVIGLFMPHILLHPQQKTNQPSTCIVESYSQFPFCSFTPILLREYQCFNELWNILFCARAHTASSYFKLASFRYDRSLNSTYIFYNFGAAQNVLHVPNPKSSDSNARHSSLIPTALRWHLFKSYSHLQSTSQGLSTASRLNFLIPLACNFTSSVYISLSPLSKGTKYVLSWLGPFIFSEQYVSDHFYLIMNKPIKHVPIISYISLLMMVHYMKTVSTYLQLK